MLITNTILEDLSNLYGDLHEGKFVPGQTKLRSAAERTANTETPAQKRRREAEKKRREELESKADNILAGLQGGAKPKPAAEKEEPKDTPKANVRRLPRGVKRDETAAAADEILKQLRSEEVLSEKRKRAPKRWWDDDGDGIGYEPGEVSGKFKKGKKKVAKESFSNWRNELFEIANSDDDSEHPKINDKKKVKNKIKTSAMGGGIKLGEEIEENLGGTLIEMIEINEIDFIIETVYDDLVSEGYYEDDIEDALEYALVEAKVTYGHDTEKPYEKNISTRRMVGALGRLARMRLKSKGKELRAAASQKAVDAYRKGQEMKQSADDASRKFQRDIEIAKKRVKEAPEKTKKSIKGGIRNLAQKIVDRMSEDYDLHEKSLSISQQQAAGAALAAKRGDISPSKLKGASLEMYKTMSEKQLRDYAKTKHEGLPEKVSEEMMPLSQRELMLHKQKTAIDTRLAQEKRKKLQKSNSGSIEEAKLPRSQKLGKRGIKQSKTLKLTDCDDCTHDQSHPDAAKIDLKDKTTGQTKKRLTPGEFAHHKPSDSETYGFDDFRSTKKVKDTTKPNKRIVTALNKEEYEQIDERVRRYPQQRAITARGAMDDNKGFTDDMRNRIGVKNLKSVSFTGNMRPGKDGKKLSGPEKKAVVAKHIAKKNPDAKKIDFYDDHKGNVEAVADTLAKPGKLGRKRVSGPKVRGFVAKPDKSGEVRPVRLGGEGGSGRRGIRSSIQPSSKGEAQKRRKKSM
jgi:hypothetical protein